VRWLARWWPALVWAGVIWTFSTAAFTSEHTSRIILPILHWLFPHAARATLLYMHHLIRKSAHFLEYFVFSLLLLRGIRAGRRETHLAWAVAAIAGVAGYAALDELHQWFVPGRTAAVSDVLLDASGGVAAQLIVALLFLWRGVRMQRKSKGAAEGTAPAAADPD
jgi:VanZ family protein